MTGARRRELVAALGRLRAVEQVRWVEGSVLLVLQGGETWLVQDGKPEEVTLELLALVAGVFARDPGGCCVGAAVLRRTAGEDVDEDALERARGRGHRDCAAIAEALGRLRRGQRAKLAALSGPIFPPGRATEERVAVEEDEPRELPDEVDEPEPTGREISRKSGLG